MEQGSKVGKNIDLAVKKIRKDKEILEKSQEKNGKVMKEFRILN